MFDYLLDVASQDDLKSAEARLSGSNGSPPQLYMTRYQKERQRVYDRARRMLSNPQSMHLDMEAAKAEAAMAEAEAKVSRARGDQIAWVKSLLRANTGARLGYRSQVDLVTSRIDVHRSTARDLLFLARRLSEPQIHQIRQGGDSYVRVLEESRLAEAGAGPEEIARTRDMSLDKVQDVARRHRRMERSEEKRVFEGQYVSFQPSLDGTHVRVSGRMGAYEAEICRRGLDKRGENLVPEGESPPDPGLRRVLALTSLCQDALDDHPGRALDPRHANRRAPILTVLTHEPLASASGYEKGVEVLGGARVGPDTVDLVRCLGRIEDVTVTGQKVTTHQSVSGIRPALRRGVLARDGRCTIAGCRSTYRLEVHHIVPRSAGGDHGSENLTTLCWWHHHVTVHRRGMRIDPHSPPHRRRLLPARRASQQWRPMFYARPVRSARPERDPP